MQKSVVTALVFGTVALTAGFSNAQTSRHEAATMPVARKNVSAEQLARLAERAERIQQILNAAEPDMQAQHVSPENQRWLVESLYQMPLTQLRRIGR